MTGFVQWSALALCIALTGLAGCVDANVTSVGTVAGRNEVALHALADYQDEWIVLFNRGLVGDPRAEAEQLVSRFGGEIQIVYPALNGFAGKLPEAAVAALRRGPNVRALGPNGPVRLYGHAMQSSPGWAIDRVDQRTTALDGAYNYTSDGAGVNIYVIDTGILDTHQDLVGRVLNRYKGSSATFDDCVSGGHGTGVASAAAGSTYGIAKAATIHNVKANCAGIETLLAGIDWVIVNHQKPAVATMSLGWADCTSTPGGSGEGNQPTTHSCPGATHAPLDSAVADLVAAGVLAFVAAGNDGTDACNTSPARVAEAFTVGASDVSDGRWDAGSHGSNWGSCVDMFAPGADVTVASSTSNTSSLTTSGTSLSAPFAAGAAALYLQTSPNASPAAVASALSSRSTYGVLSNIGTGSPNQLLFAAVPVAAEIGGPTAIHESGDYQWEAFPAGGTGHYSYQWARRYVYQNGPGPWADLGTSKTQTLSVHATENDFQLRVLVTSGGDSRAAYLYVYGPCDNTNDLQICPSKAPVDRGVTPIQRDKTNSGH